MANLITRKELDDLKEQLTRMPTDKDRLRLMNRTASAGFRYTCENVKELIEVQHFGEATLATAIKLYPSTVDQQNYLTVVIPAFKFPEHQAEVKAKLGL
eukprot:TRINITY_DN2437_c0_g9_i1.p1 TRINITY_DN2437_c0_g9~~TRINITY_DN2437_c0_g9_i1.p1  ORF type:complete len:116 (-),score=37.05 TRINITY_DN2437_c0_g9_i1:463-759(-)